jgi:hypothetical protein
MGSLEESAMSFLNRSKSYITRVIKNDATRHGVAAAGAGVVLSLIVEALWPTLLIL